MVVVQIPAILLLGPQESFLTSFYCQHTHASWFSEHVQNTSEHSNKSNDNFGPSADQQLVTLCMESELGKFIHKTNAQFVEERSIWS